MFDQSMRYIWEAIGLGIATIILSLLEVLRRRVGKRPPTLLRFNAAHQTIHLMLAELRVRAEGSRAFVVQFRNGVKFDIHAPLFRAYMTHEVVGPGIAPVTQAWSEIPASQIYELIAPLFSTTSFAYAEAYPFDAEKKCAHRIRTASLSEGSLKSMLIVQGTSSMVLAPMVVDDAIVGFIGIDYRASAVMTDDAPEHACNTSSNIVYELQKAVDEVNRSFFVRALKSLRKKDD